MGYNILSLFDGMSGAQQALERAGFKVDNYYASEVDKYAIKVTMANYPNTIQLGDVTKLDTSILPKIDILFAGSPCTDFSFAGKRKGLSTKCSEEILTLSHYLELKNDGFEFEGQSYLFWEFMRIREEIKPTYFFLENVEMGEKWEKVLSKAVGVNGIHINSSLLSAQNRQRIYWLNWGMKPSGLFGDMENIITQPKDKGILLKDILQDNPDSKYTISEKMMNYMRNRSKNYNSGKINYKYGDDKASCINKSSASIDISENIIVVDEKYYLSDKSIAYINRDKRNLGFQMDESDDKLVCVTANFTKQIPYN
jgi:DNA (cytosine-5)-methyltransferase 3A